MGIQPYTLPIPTPFTINHKSRHELVGLGNHSVRFARGAYFDFGDFLDVRPLLVWLGGMP